MTNLQVVKALDAQIEASFKRSAVSLEETTLRGNIRAIQDVFRRAHVAGVKNARLSHMSERNLLNVTPAMAQGLCQVLAPHDGGAR